MGHLFFSTPSPPPCTPINAPTDNSASTYFGAFPANHAAQFSSYIAPLLDWVPAARAQAQAQASAAHVSCPATALHFACHLAPWGFQSDDQTIYMHWNLNFALLPVISQWEYTQDLEAARAALPLLEGATAWWACFLARNASTGLLHDANPFNPDAQHEGQLVSDPQIGLTLLLRGASAHIDIARALGLPPPQGARGIVQSLTPFNTAVVGVTPGGVTRNYSSLPNWRLQNDEHMGTARSPADCAHQCDGAEDCECYTFCASPATPGCPDGPSCWFYPPAQAGTGHAGPGFTSGCALSPPPPQENVTVWTSFAGATPSQSDTFAFYPTYPSEALGGLLPLSPLDRLTSQSSSSVYTGSWVSDRRPLDVFVAAVLGLTGSSARAANALTLDEILSGLNAYLAAYLGSNQLAYAPGGGVENAGVSRAVSEMLLGSGLLVAAGEGGAGGGASLPAAWYARLFPAWPANASARFAGLLAKGGCEYSAELEGGVVGSPVGVRAAYARSGAAAVNCSLASPWGQDSSIAVACAGQSVPVAWLQVSEGHALSFLAPAGVSCSVSRGA